MKVLPISLNPKVQKIESYLYIRMSTAEQLRGDSLRRQMQIGIEYADSHALNLPKNNIMQDIGISAFTGDNVERGKLGVFVKKVTTGEINKGTILLVESIDRLSRQTPIDGIFLFYDLLQRGIVIVTLTDGRIYDKATSDLGSLVTSLVTISRGHEESDMKSIRLNASWERKRSNIKSKKLTRICPSWLVPNSSLTEFQPISSRVEIVRRIYRDALSGMGVFAIVSRLNQDQIPTFGRSRRWTKSTVTRFLTTRAVVGEFQPSVKRAGGRREPVGEPITNYFPKIIEEQEFAQVQHGRRSRKITGMGRKGTGFNNLFSKLAVCGLCGEPMHFVNKGASQKGGQYLFCSASKGGRCTAKAWRYPLFERAFLSHVRELDLNSLFAGDTSELENVRQLMALKDDQLTALDAKMVRLTDMLLETNADSDFIPRRLTELEREGEVLRSDKLTLTMRFELLTAQAVATNDNEHAKIIAEIQTAKAISIVSAPRLRRGFGCLWKKLEFSRKFRIAP